MPIFTPYPTPDEITEHRATAQHSTDWYEKQMKAWVFAALMTDPDEAGERAVPLPAHYMNQVVNEARLDLMDSGWRAAVVRRGRRHYLVITARPQP